MRFLINTVSALDLGYSCEKLPSMGWCHFMNGNWNIDLMNAFRQCLHESYVQLLPCPRPREIWINKNVYKNYVAGHAGTALHILFEH
jgi:hypothetical protein